jgi:hypothetical protein
MSLVRLALKSIAGSPFYQIGSYTTRHDARPVPLNMLKPNSNPECILQTFAAHLAADLCFSSWFFNKYITNTGILLV